MTSRRSPARWFCTGCAPRKPAVRPVACPECCGWSESDPDLRVRVALVGVADGVSGGSLGGWARTTEPDTRTGENAGRAPSHPTAITEGDL